MEEIKIIKEKIVGEYIFKPVLESYLTNIIRIKRDGVVTLGRIASVTPRGFTIKTIPIATESVRFTYDVNQVREWFTIYNDTGISIYDPVANSITDLTMSDLIKNNFKRVYEFDTSVIKPGMDILVVKDEGEKGYMSAIHVLDVGKDLIKFTTYAENIFDKTIYKKKFSKGGYYIEATPEQLANEYYSYHYEEKCADRKTVTTFDHYFETGDGYFDATTAFKYLIDGKKVRQVDWTPDEYIKLCRYRESIIDESNEEVNQNIIIVGRDAKWEIFKEVTEDALR